MLHIFKKKSIRYGVPFILFMVGAPFWLREFQEIRFKYKPLVEPDIQEEAAKLGLKMKDKNEITLESEYEKMKNKDFDNWENKRIPRPWEENPSTT